MTDTPTPEDNARVCAVCARVLAKFTDPDGETTWVHGLQDDKDHLPVPVLREEVQTRFRCDFCNADESKWILPTREFELPFTGGVAALLADGPTHMSRADWSACDTCAKLIDTNKWTALLRRVSVYWEKEHGKMHEAVRTNLAALHRRVRKNITGSLKPFVPPSAGPSEGPGIIEWGQQRSGGLGEE